MQLASLCTPPRKELHKASADICSHRTKHEAPLILLLMLIDEILSLRSVYCSYTSSLKASCPHRLRATSAVHPTRPYKSTLNSISCKVARSRSGPSPDPSSASHPQEGEYLSPAFKLARSFELKPVGDNLVCLQDNSRSSRTQTSLRTKCTSLVSENINRE